jgi:hypothetical protein
MPEPREAKQGFDHMGVALTGRHFHAHTRVSVARIPPIVPYIRLDGGNLTLAKDARLAAVLHGQFTFKNGEAFDYPGMAVFADDPRSDKPRRKLDWPARHHHPGRLIFISTPSQVKCQGADSRNF